MTLPRIVAVLSCGVLLAACASAPQGQAGGWVAASGSDVIAPDQRVPAPHVEAETLTGEVLVLGDLEGPVLVNFWASWCGPCAAEAPHLQAVHEEFGPQGLQVRGVNVRDSRSNALSFERDFGIGYPSWYDRSASIAAGFGGIGPAGLPSTILLDRDHRVAARWFGAVTAMRISPTIEAVLGESAAQGGSS